MMNRYHLKASLITSLFMLCVCYSSTPVVIVHEDLRGFILQRKGKDLRKLDLRGIDLTKTTFDSFTPWPPSNQMPAGFDPNALMEWGKYPGLGMRKLHNRSITGEGVHVAIIDQPLLKNHVEYRDQLASYVEIDTGKAGPQWHGTVASILVGKTCGVAPKAILHYWAEPAWKKDCRYRCEALEQIIEFNKEKEIVEQIRVVSVSKGFSPNEPNLARWKDLLERAKQNNIYVIHCSRHIFGVGCPAFRDSDDPNNYQLWSQFPNPTLSDAGRLFAPVDNRTIASHLGDQAYVFKSSGGLSWAPPYIAGVAALGLQINPYLSESQIEHLLYNTGITYHKGKLIDPVSFIEAVKKLRAK